MSIRNEISLMQDKLIGLARDTKNYKSAKCVHKFEEQRMSRVSRFTALKSAKKELSRVTLCCESYYGPIYSLSSFVTRR